MANLSGAALGALGGAGSGAALGSLFFPGIGTGIGALGGGLLGGLSGLFGGGKEGAYESALNPQQTEAQGLILQQLMDMLRNPQLQSQGFQPIENLARQQFQQSTIPSIAERFSSMGARGSSAFAQSLGQAGTGLESQLAALRSQYGMQNRNALLNAGLQQTQNYNASQPGAGENILSGFMQALPSLLKAYTLQQQLTPKQ